MNCRSATHPHPKHQALLRLAVTQQKPMNTVHYWRQIFFVCLLALFCSAQQHPVFIESKQWSSQQGTIIVPESGTQYVTFENTSMNV